MKRLGLKLLFEPVRKVIFYETYPGKLRNDYTPASKISTAQASHI